MSSCGTGTKQKEDPFYFRNHFPLPVRIMVGLFGCVLWLLPYYLLIAPQWNHFSWLLIPYGVLGLVGALGGTTFLLSAIMGEQRETRLDFGAQKLVQTSRDWLFRPRQTCTDFVDIAILDLSQPKWATEETIITIQPILENGDSLPAFGAFTSLEEAEKIKALMGHRPEGLDALPATWTKAELAALKASMEAQTARQARSPSKAIVPTLH